MKVTESKKKNLKPVAIIGASLLLIAFFSVVGILFWMRFIFDSEELIDEVMIPNNMSVELIAVPTDEYNHGVKAILNENGSELQTTEEVFYTQTEFYNDPFKWKYSLDNNLVGIYYPEYPDDILFVVNIVSKKIFPQKRFEKLPKEIEQNFEPSSAPERLGLAVGKKQ